MSNKVGQLFSKISSERPLERAEAQRQRGHAQVLSLIVPSSAEMSSNTVVISDVKETVGQNLWQEDLESASLCKYLLDDMTMKSVRGRQDRGYVGASLF